MNESRSTTHLQILIDRLRAGDDNAKEEIIAYAANRLVRLAKIVLADHPSARKSGVETWDVVSEATLGLMSSLRAARTEHVGGFMTLAAIIMRHRLLDILKKKQPISNLASDETGPPVIDRALSKDGPVTQAEWREFHSCIECLPSHQREIFNLLYYMGLSQQDAAQQLGVSVRTIKRSWRETKEAVYDLCHGEKPGH